MSRHLILTFYETSFGNMIREPLAMLITFPEPVS